MLILDGWALLSTWSLATCVGYEIKISSADEAGGDDPRSLQAASPTFVDHVRSAYGDVRLRLVGGTMPRAR